MSAHHSWHRIDTLAGLIEHQGAWRRARGETPPDPYLDPLWYATWWEHFGSDDDEDAALWILALSGPAADPEARAYVPLMRRDGTLSFIGNVYSHRQGVTASGHWPHFMERLLDVLQSRRAWDHVRLDHLPDDGPEATQLRKLLKGDCTWREEAGEVELWALPEDTDSDSAARWQTHLDSQGRESRRKRRRMYSRAEEIAATTTPLSLCQYTDVSGARAFARQYMQILSGSWKMPEMSRSFFRQLCQETAEKGWFHSFVLQHGETPIACQLGFLCHGTYHCYKTAYIQQYSACSPGILVMDMAFEALFVDGLAQRIDLLTGDTPYKQLWCNQKRQQVAFCLGTPPAPSAPPQKPREPAHIAMSWTPARHVSHPLEGGQLKAAEGCPPIALALAMGAPNLNTITARLDSPHWQGFAWQNDNGQLCDVVWLEHTETPQLHLPPPFVKAQRPIRQALIAALLEDAHVPRVEAHIHPAHRATLLALGFSEESGEQ